MIVLRTASVQHEYSKSTALPAACGLILFTVVQSDKAVLKFADDISAVKVGRLHGSVST